MPEVPPPTTNEQHPNGLTIRKLKPSQIQPTDYQTLGLTSLIAKAYGYQGSEEHLQEMAEAVFSGDDATETIFLVIEDGKAVGMASVTSWEYPKGDVMGNRFWRRLQRDNPSILAKLKKHDIACDISDIAVLPELQNKRIGALLYRQVVDELHPVLIVGQTKSVGAVMSRTHALSDIGYRTFYGQVEVSSTQQSTINPSSLLNAYADAWNTTLDTHNVLYTNGEHLASTVPNVSSAPQQIQQAFQPVIHVQQLQNAKPESERQTAIQPLISVKEELLT